MLRMSSRSPRRSWPMSLLALGLLALGGLAACDDTIRNEAFPSLNISPESLTFPTLSVGDSQDLMVTVENVGAGDLKIADLTTTLSNEFNIYWRLSTQLDNGQRVAVEGGENFFDGVVTIPSGETLTLIVNYVPADLEADGGEIRFDSNDPARSSVRIPVSVTAGGAELLVRPDPVEFGRVPSGASDSITLTATNIGQDPLVLDRLQLAGSPDFTITVNDEDPADNPDVLRDPDGDGIDGVGPDRSFEVVVTYSPSTDDIDNGQLVFITNARVPEKVVELTANGASPCINVVPGTLEFRPVLVDREDRGRIVIESCGGEGLRLEGIELIDDGGGVFRLDEDTLPPFPSLLPPLDREQEPPVAPSRGITVIFLPPDEQVYEGRVAISTNDPAFPVVEVPIVGRGTRNECPVAAVAEAEYVVLPLDIVTLDASPSSDPDGPGQRPEQYQWTVVDRPAGSTAVPVEQFHNPLRPADGGPPDSPETPFAQFFVDLTGEYVIELRVVDSLGAIAPSDQCEQPLAQVRILAEPDEDIHVQMVWDTPGDDTSPVNPQTDGDGSDVDLWLLHPRALSWNDIGRRCYYGNPSPDWGVLNQVDDNPSLDIDDVNGAGPENINLNNPENTQDLGGAYRVAAHYYRSFRELGIGDYGPSMVTMRIYLGGALAFEADRELIDTDDFWEVASIVWTPGDRRVQPINRFYERPPN